MLHQVAISESGDFFLLSSGSQALVRKSHPNSMPTMQALVQLEMTRCSAFCLFSDGSVWELPLSANRSNPVRVDPSAFETFRKVIVTPPVSSQAPRGISAISCGSYHCCLLSRSGELYGVGGGSDGQFGHPGPFETNARPIEGTYPTGISHITTNRNVTVVRVGMKKTWAGSAMLKLFQKDDYKDCMLKSSKSGASVSIHRILLASRTRFTSFSESIDCGGNISQSAFDSFGSWLYSDMLDPSAFELKDELMSLASFFCAPRLTEILSGELAAESVLEQDLANTVGRFEELSDFSIDCGDGSQPILAHKVLLSRCPYFQTLFASNFNEALNGKVSISDANANGMVHLLRYVYSDAVDRDMDINDCIDTLLCCNALLLPDLKLRMELEIMKGIDLDCAAFVYNVAFVSGAEKLKNVALNVMMKSSNPLALIQDLEDDEVRDDLRKRLKKRMLMNGL